MSEHFAELIQLLEEKQRLFDQVIALNEDIRYDASAMEHSIRQMRSADSVLQ